MLLNVSHMTDLDHYHRSLISIWGQLSEQDSKYQSVCIVCISNAYNISIDPYLLQCINLIYIIDHLGEYN